MFAPQHTTVMSRKVNPRGPSLTIEQGRERGRRFNLPRVGGHLLLGRAPECNVRFDNVRELMVSARHARVDVSPDGVTLTDLNSTNKTLVNGQAVQGSVRLWNGDRIQLGANDGPILLVRLTLQESPPATIPGRPVASLWPSEDKTAVMPGKGKGTAPFEPPTPAGALPPGGRPAQLGTQASLPQGRLDGRPGAGDFSVEDPLAPGLHAASGPRAAPSVAHEPGTPPPGARAEQQLNLAVLPDWHPGGEGELPGEALGEPEFQGGQQGASSPGQVFLTAGSRPAPPSPPTDPNMLVAGPPRETPAPQQAVMPPAFYPPGPSWPREASSGSPPGSAPSSGRPTPAVQFPESAAPAAGFSVSQDVRGETGSAGAPGAERLPAEGSLVVRLANRFLEQPSWQMQASVIAVAMLFSCLLGILRGLSI